MDIDISQVTQSVNIGESVPAAKTTVEETAPDKALKPVKDDYAYENARLDYSRRSSGYRSMRTRGRSVWDTQTQKPRVEISRPRDNQNQSSVSKLRDIIKQVQRQYHLPKSDSIAKSLNNSTRSEIVSLSRQAIADSELVNPQKFLEALEKSLPLALSTLNEGQSSFPADSSKMLAQLTNELLLLINQLMLSPNLTKELKAQLQTLAQLLGEGKQDPALVQQISLLIEGKAIHNNGKSVVDVRGKQKLIEQLVSLKVLPGKYLEVETIPLKILEAALVKLDKGMKGSLNQAIALLNSSTSSKLQGSEMLMTQLTMLKAMLQGISDKSAEQAKTLQLIVGNQMLFAVGGTKSILGTKTQELGGKMADLIVNLAGQLGLPGNHSILNRSGSESLLRLFSSILFGGAMMGRLIADRGDGKPWAMDEVYAGMLQAQSVRELKIFDLIPFSLFAFFSPLKREESSQQKEKELLADQLLKKLIRLVMKLAFMLTSIYTGGKKIGLGGVDAMLKQHREQLDEVIKDLLRTLRRIDDIGRADVKSSMIFLRRGRQALIEKDNAVFWKCVFSFFTDKNDLNAFLSEVEELDSTYSSIRKLIIDI